jgi:hypothetical protein
MIHRVAARYGVLIVLCMLAGLPGRARSEATAPTTKCCDFQGCFQSAASASALEKANKCQLCNPCTATVQKLQQLPQTPGDPTDGFALIQTCIASKACAGKATLNDPAWLDAVVPTFVNPFLEQSGQWPAVESSCRALPKYVPGRDLICQARMAYYHITNDLQNALNTQGCGTASDWKAVGTIISNCVSSDYATYPPGVRQTFTFVADYVVQTARNSARGNCIAYRTKNKLPLPPN